MSRFLIFCSGASLELLEKCPRFENTKYVCIGLTVFFTAVLATISSFFAFSLIFDQTSIIVFFSLLWGAIIFNLDRYIVSTMRHSDSRFEEIIKVAPRLIIAFLIAVIISKPLEIQIFKNEIQSYLMVQSTQKIADVDLKYSSRFNELDEKKSLIDSQYNALLMLREKYYEDYKCECDGTCGTQKIGRGIECLSKKDKYEQFIKELSLEKVRRDSSLVNIAKLEHGLKIKIKHESGVLEASSSSGLIDKIRALNKIDKFSSMFIILIFVMIETAPIFTKLLSSKGPYDNLILELESAFETNYLKALDNFDHERQKNKKLKEMSSRLELKSKESEIKNITKQEARDRYDKIRAELEKKTFEN
ncbi:MAG: hypothetical protein CBD72_02150 [Flavobacteriaceae bacterium TMED212]|nr:MAG: hypothetical protein CBD72_02150 [Flavobacteriaceae bacterium TMED212]|tara:strand:- start:3603 stop:4685 length:1083 start_codon:yes stop_codon:yes gene_type:complete